MKKLVLILLFLFVLGEIAFAGIFSVEPSYLGVGARSLSLGNTTAATFKRSEAIFRNPAGLAQVDLMNFNYMYGKYFDKDVGYSIFSFVYPTRHCNLGFGYGGINVGGIYQTTAPLAPGTMPGIGNTLAYSNRVFIFSFAKNYKNIDYGLNFKLFRQNLTGGTINQGSAGGYDFDIGLSYKFRNIRLYLSTQNLLPTKITTDSGAKEDMPSQTNLGISTELLKGKLILAGDIKINGEANRPITLHTGIEYQPYEFISLRAGLEEEPASPTDRYHNVTLGLGLNYGGFNFDYAWKQANNLGENNSNFFTIGFTPLRKYFFKGEALIKAVASPPLVTLAQREKTEFLDINKISEKKEIEFVSGLEIAQGKSDGLFHPKEALQKVEAAKIIFKCLKLKGKNEGTNIFYVINGKKNSYNVVMQIKEKGKTDAIRKFEVTGIKPLKRYSFNWQGEDELGNEVKPGLYEYEIKVKDDKNAENDFKGEIAVKVDQIVSTAKMPAQFKNFYKDIPATHWAAGIIYKLSQEGIIKEDKAKIYNPNRKITHREFLLALANAIERNNVKFYSNRGIKKDILTSFKGVSKLNTKEKQYLQLFYQGLEKSYPHLNLDSPVTRAQAAKIIYNFVEML